MADPSLISALGDELYGALRSREVVEPLSSRHPELTIDDAYGISLHMLERRLADGEQVIGKKIGVTSAAVQNMLGVHQPDFGFLTDRMLVPRGEAMPASTSMIQPRAEGEIAFRLAKGLTGPGVTQEDVLDATEAVYACFEVVDSRVRDWKIGIVDTVADNASCGMLVIGDGVDPRGVDLAACEMVVHKNGEELSRGLGSAVQGSPLAAVAWLANTLGAYGITLDAGDLILSGSLVPLEPVLVGDEMWLEIDGIGRAEVTFS